LYIIVEIDSVKELNRFMNDIYEKYRDKIRTMERCRKTIVLINGACIKIIPTSRDADGYRADVAIGPRADIFTCISTHKKRIWDFIDLEDYLKSI
jgi:hypothetical protein